MATTLGESLTVLRLDDLLNRLCRSRYPAARCVAANENEHDGSEPAKHSARKTLGMREYCIPACFYADCSPAI